jgi:hypothetical protein
VGDAPVAEEKAVGAKGEGEKPFPGKELCFVGDVHVGVEKEGAI